MTTETPTPPSTEYKGEREPGVYPAIFVRFEPFLLYEGTAEQAWKFRWTFEDGGGEFDCLTGSDYTPRSNALAMLTGILGRTPVKGDDPNKLIGAKVNCVYGPNKGGTLTITSVLPFKDK